MNCLVTAGPTYEPLDQVRRLTNFSTGRLGIELANDLVAHGHQVTLLISETATWPGERQAQRVETFSTTASLREKLAAHSGNSVGAVFHAAAVSDFTFSKTWTRSAAGELIEISAGKISTSHESLLVELKPTTKIIAHLRDWFPQARITGWKYEVDGARADVLDKARRQIEANRTDACVANGPAYGGGFGVLQRDGSFTHTDDLAALLGELRRLLV